MSLIGILWVLFMPSAFPSLTRQHQEDSNSCLFVKLGKTPKPSPCWTNPALSASSPCIRNVLCLYTSSWPFTGLAPHSPHSIPLGSPAPDPEFHMQLTKAQQGGKIIPQLGGHALPYAAQDATGYLCWLMVTPCSRTPRAFSAKLLSSLSSALCYTGLFLQRQRTCPLPNTSRLLGAVQLPLKSSTAVSSPPSSVLSAALLKVHSTL